MAAFQTLEDGAVKILTVAGRLEPLNGKDLRDTMNAMIDDAGAVDLIVDLEHMDYMASAGFRELFFAGKKLTRQDGRLVVCSLRGDVKRIFDIAHFDTAYPVFESREAALVYFRAPKA